MKLWTYFRSSASYRARIALALKGLPYEHAPVHLVRGEQLTPEFRAISPQGVVPALEDAGQVITQSMAIIEYLEETHPDPPLLPRDPAGRARVRAIALTIACDTHPLNNLRVLKYLTGTLGVSDVDKGAWYQHWTAAGLSAVERLVAGDPRTGRFCHGDAPTIANVCLVPQLFNARRFGCPVDAYPTLVRIEAACQALPAFRDAAPANQPDAEA